MSSFVKAEVVRRISASLDAANLRVAELQEEVDELRQQNDELRREIERLSGPNNLEGGLDATLEGMTKPKIAEFALAEFGLDLNPDALSKKEMIAEAVKASESKK